MKSIEQSSTVKDLFSLPTFFFNESGTRVTGLTYDYSHTALHRKVTENVK